MIRFVNFHRYHHGELQPTFPAHRFNTRVTPYHARLDTKILETNNKRLPMLLGAGYQSLIPLGLK